MRMTKNMEGVGPKLYAWLEGYWKAHDTNLNAWSSQFPAIQAPTVTRWRSGSTPSLTAMQAVAEAMNVSMLDILIISGVIDADELAAGDTAPRFERLPILRAIELAPDDDLDDWEREQLRDVVNGMREWKAERESAKRPRPRRKS